MSHKTCVKFQLFINPLTWVKNYIYIYIYNVNSTDIYWPKKLLHCCAQANAFWRLCFDQSKFVLEFSRDIPLEGVNVCFTSELLLINASFPNSVLWAQYFTLCRSWCIFWYYKLKPLCLQHYLEFKYQRHWRINWRLVDNRSFFLSFFWWFLIFSGWKFLRFYTQIYLYLKENLMFFPCIIV